MLETNSIEAYQNLFWNAPIGIFMSTPEGRYVYTNPAMARMCGYDSPEEMTAAVTDIATEVYVDPGDRNLCKRLLKKQGEVVNREVRFRRRDGSIFWVSINAQTVKDQEGRIIAYQGYCSDISHRKQAEEALQQSEERHRTLYEATPAMLHSIDRQGCIISVSDAWLDKLGYARDEVLGRRFIDYLTEASKHRALEEHLPQFFSTGSAMNLAYQMVTRNGQILDVLLSSVADYDASGNYIRSMAITADITERKRAEKAYKKLQEEYLQSQKLEAVGLLAGGVAHDFNNMLSVIQGYAEIAALKLESYHPCRSDLDQICKAAQRSADLTRQLLAFARKQTIAPKVLDLNRTVASMLKMLRRLIGENIDLVWLPAFRAWPVKMDPIQIDQILANLCVNARNAIDGVGKLTIATNNVTIDETFSSRNTDFIPGEYVRLTVSDDGCGMDKRILAHIFEPFFTTREIGRGTGLGLATVYGIVKQNGGNIDVYSEPGRGTTFRIYLPRHADQTEAIESRQEAPIPPGRGETVLLVEDELSVLEVGQKMLDTLGYSVLTANTPKEALRLAQAQAGAIQLLITDVVMPEMNGRELAGHLRALYPNLKTMFISGYTADIITCHGILEPDVYFIQKPFLMMEMAAKVREALEGRTEDGKQRKHLSEPFVM